MGKNKWYFESETSNKQQATRPSNSAANKHRRASYAPGHFVQESPESMPLPALLRLVWLRLRRSWVALRFQANRYSLGFFRKQALLKLGFLMLAGYFLLNSERAEILASVGESVGEGKARETTLEVGGGEASYTSKPEKKSKIKNEAAPVSASDLLREQSLDYVDRFHDIAIGEMKKFGIPASISLAQGLIESRAGTSKLAVRNNNHFGIKCFSRRCGKGHCSNFTDDTHKDFFRKFENAWGSWRAHSQLISSGRYSKLKQHGKDYRKWAHGLKALGYATDRDYDVKLIGVIERYDLQKYDD